MERERERESEWTDGDVGKQRLGTRINASRETTAHNVIRPADLFYNAHQTGRAPSGFRNHRGIYPSIYLIRLPPPAVSRIRHRL